MHATCLDEVASAFEICLKHFHAHFRHFRHESQLFFLALDENNPLWWHTGDWKQLLVKALHSDIYGQFMHEDLSPPACLRVAHFQDS